MKCSSFVGINVGTSGRSKCSSVGLPDVASVIMSNGLAERRGVYCKYLIVV